MKSTKPTVEQLLVVLGGLLITGCDKQKETPAAEPSASASAPVAASPPPAASPAVGAKDVTPATSASGGKEKKCTPGGCAPGACG